MAIRLDTINYYDKQNVLVSTSYKVSAGSYVRFFDTWEKASKKYNKIINAIEYIKHYNEQLEKAKSLNDSSYIKYFNSMLEKYTREFERQCNYYD